MSGIETLERDNASASTAVVLKIHDLDEEGDCSAFAGAGVVDFFSADMVKRDLNQGNRR